MSRETAARAAAIYHCPFCAEEDLRPVEEPTGAWACQACARVFTVTLARIEASGIPGRVAEETARAGEGRP
jgi:ribosomal protein L37AE/L43A